jgi:hypothetical protein
MTKTLEQRASGTMDGPRWALLLRRDASSIRDTACQQQVWKTLHQILPAAKIGMPKAAEPKRVLGKREAHA